MTYPIRHELTHHRYLRERLEAAFPDAEEETLMDTLEGMTSLTDSLAELLRSGGGLIPTLRTPGRGKRHGKLLSRPHPFTRRAGRLPARFSCEGYDRRHRGRDRLAG